MSAPVWLNAASGGLSAVCAEAVPCLAAALLHEAGHALACLSLGVPIRHFRPRFLGAVIGYDASGLSYRHEAWIAAAGPAANLLGVLACLPGECGRGRALFGVACLALSFWVFRRRELR